ncbi:unnamed protein product, partial [Symbiodinium sp. CCMP2456]
SALLEEDVLLIGNESANDSDGWNETEVPINISIVTEAINVSEDLLEDDNESTELDGNLSDATEENVSEVSNSSGLDQFRPPKPKPRVWMGLFLVCYFRLSFALLRLKDISAFKGKGLDPCSFPKRLQ